MIYAPAHNFQACDVSHTHTGQTPFLVVKERKPRSLSTVLVLTSVVSQCVTEEGKKKSLLSERARPA